MEEMMMENAPLSAHEITGELMEESVNRDAQEAQELETICIRR